MIFFNKRIWPEVCEDGKTPKSDVPESEAREILLLGTSAFGFFSQLPAHRTRAADPQRSTHLRHPTDVSFVAEMGWPLPEGERQRTFRKHPQQSLKPENRGPKP